MNEYLGMQAVVLHRLNHYGIRPSSNLGQHFLVDSQAIELLVSKVKGGLRVVEVGSGTGHIAEVLAQRAEYVTGVEIDTRFRELLLSIGGRYRNMNFVFGDVLTMNTNRLFGGIGGRSRMHHVVSNLAFNIVEPFLLKMVTYPINDATLILGGRSIQSVMAISERDPDFNKLSLIVGAYYEIVDLGKLEPEAFMPKPDTSANILHFILRTRVSYRGDYRNFVLSRVLSPANGTTMLMNVINSSLAEYSTFESYREKRTRTSCNRSAIKQAMRRLKDVYNYQNDRLYQSDYVNEQVKGVLGRLPARLVRKQIRTLTLDELRQLSAVLRI